MSDAPPPTTAGSHAPLLTRDARPAERDAIRDLTWAAYAEYRDAMTPAAWRGLEAAVRAGLDAGLDAGTAECIVADRDGRLLGSVLLFPPAADAYAGAAAAGTGPEVRLLAVVPAARGGGVARALMDVCVRRARTQGAPEIGLHTSRSMKAAIALYEAMGFIRAPERDFQPPGAELVTGYRLPLDV